MTDEWTTDAWEEAVRSVFRRALLEPRFRQLALENPAAAFAEATGKQPPAKVRFVEALDEQVLVLPKLVRSDGELSEIDLSRILHHSFRQQSIPPAFKA